MLLNFAADTPAVGPQPEALISIVGIENAIFAESVEAIMDVRCNRVSDGEAVDECNLPYGKYTESLHRWHPTSSVGPVVAALGGYLKI